jgi:tetratricopeptide (TPR) repeat protein
MMLEKHLNNISKLLEEKDFETIQEAQAFLDNMLKSGKPIPEVEAETPLERAQELIYQAYEETSTKRRAALARQALEISPDCADAYNILAETEHSPEKALELFEQAMAAGERAIGAEGFHELEGNFWSATETRPYMRAAQNVAELSWLLGQRSRAIEMFERMLRLNPNDNQGIRYRLVSYYLEEGDDKAAIKLLKKYKNDVSATWVYSQALVIFRAKGPGAIADKALGIAFNHNPHVPDYLLGKKRMPFQMPEYIGFGDTSEAIEYVASDKRTWAQTPGALDWLSQRYPTLKAHKPSGKE